MELETINHTNMTLIPKIKDPTQVSQFCPISLCSVIYKIISKMMANRLNFFVPEIISIN